MIEWALLGILSIVGILAVIMALYPLRVSIKVRLTCAVILIVFISLGYWQWGSWSEFKVFTQKQAKVKHANQMLTSMGGPVALVEAMKERLKKEPESIEGWYLLGRLYMTQFSFEKAHDAFMHAHELSPAEVKITIGFAESVWALNKESFDDKTRMLLKEILIENPNQTDALAMLAMDAYKQHDYHQAIIYWEHLLSFLPQQSDEARAIRKALVKARRHIK